VVPGGCAAATIRAAHGPREHRKGVVNSVSSGDREDLERDLNLEQTWSRIQNRLQTSLPDTVYQTWLSSLRPLRLDRSAIILEAPRGARSWVQRRFGPTLTAAATNANPALQRVEVVEPDESRGTTKDLAALPRTALRHGFETFVIGNANRFAHAAALAVAEMPGQAYNPLFLHGPSGVGKTHLLQAIAAYASTNNPALATRYATAETFTNEFLDALRHDDRLDGFKRSYRACDVLLIDDIQFLDGKVQTAQELFHTLDDAIAAGAQAVLSADRPISQLSALEPRIRERLKGGLVVDLAAPDFSARLAILQRLASESAGRPQEDVLEHLARRMKTNVRSLEGALTRLAAYASLTGNAITLPLADEILHHLYPDSESLPASSKPTVLAIQELVAKAFQTDRAALISSGRNRRLVYARQIAMYLSRELTDLSLPAIASQFGGRDHTTVLHSHRKIKQLLANNEETNNLVSTMKRSLTLHTQGASQLSTASPSSKRPSDKPRRLH
jgi:chromosomal replication initiator protein